jgi:nucleotide-binding universal stress UspA family protein
MKKICIALDTTPSAQKVAELGYAYAKALNAEVTLVHVVNDVSYYTMNYDPIMGYAGFLTSNTLELVEGLKNEAEKFLISSVKHLDNTSIKTAVLEGSSADAILEFANNWKADLIVMGTHSRSGLANLLMGSIAVDVVKHSEIPILIIPTKDK